LYWFAVILFEIAKAYMEIRAGIYKSIIKSRFFDNLFLESNNKKCSNKLYIEPQPTADTLRHIKQVSRFGAKFAIENPKDQKHREMQTKRNNLFWLALGFI